MINDSHLLSVNSPQSGGIGIQYIFKNWSDGGDQNHYYTVPINDQQLTVNFNARYKLTVNSTYGNPSGTGWYEEGMTAYFSVTSPEVFGSTRYVFEKWTGDYEWDQPSGSIIMNRPVNIYASWKMQYKLTIDSEYGNPQGAGWYNVNQQASFSITSPDTRGAIRYLFINWSGDYNGSQTSCSIIMNSPKIIQANWKTQYYLTVDIDPEDGGTVTPSPPGEWFDENLQITAEAIPDTQSGYTFSHWSGDVTGSSNPFQFTLDRPKSIIAHFESESTDVSEENKTIDNGNNFILLQNYPNPFNPSTNIQYYLPENTHVKIEVYSLNGKMVRRLLDNEQPAGNHKIFWDGRGSSGEVLSSGTYIIYLKCKNSIKKIKVLLIK